MHGMQVNPTCTILCHIVALSVDALFSVDAVSVDELFSVDAVSVDAVSVWTDAPSFAF